ncbi:MAG TPA: glycosyltransferase [Candidatus Saccharimonadales bacterium]|nr:glycosyltransferase [Candidatus Saccharimonadales bacterium]
MKFIVDAQAFQTSTWHRGMGKYSLELLKALQANGHFDKYDLEFVLNSNLQLEDERKQMLDKIFPDVTYTEIDLRETNEFDLQEIQKYNRRQLNDKYNSGSFIFLIPSLFENKVTSVFPDAGRKVLIGYDLIPIFFYDRYLTHSDSVRNNYFGRFSEIFAADHIFPISQTTADDFTRHLGLPLNMLTTIDGARIDLSEKVEKPAHVPKRKFILSVSGDDQRKNNARMVEGFEKYNAATGRKYELLITSTFSKQSQQQLKKISADIRFVGNVSADELRWLYNNAASVMFVPEYEGLGLPVLEAVAANRKVICSRIPVFEEISDKDNTFFFCDPYDISSISDAVQTAVKHGEPDLKEYREIEKKYAWPRTARLFAEACEKLQPRPKKPDKKKIAVVGPLPGGKSAIGKVIEITHFSLANLVDVDYYFEIPKEDRAQARKGFVSYVANARDVSEFNANVAADYDDIIYHLGSSSYHLKSIIEALAIPGKTILHDTRFSGIYGVLQSSQMMSSARINAEETLDKLLDVTDSADHIISLVNASDEVIVHSKFAKSSVDQCFVSDEKNKRFAVEANLPIGLAQRTKRVDDKKIEIAMAGIISKAKGLAVLTDLLDSGKFNDCNFKLFGYDFAVDESILSELSRYKNLEIKTNLGELEFRRQLGKADILLNYREYYHGETSYATLEAMREGVVPLVRNVGWFSELPDNAVKKAASPDKVSFALKELIKDRAKLKRMSAACYEYVLKEHSPQLYAKQLSELV